MLYEVCHKTTYSYARSAAFSQHLLRLTPRETDEQRVHDTRIEIEPRTEALTAETDMFGNRAHVATVSRPHEALTITAISRVERQAPSQFIFEAGVPWDQVREQALGRGNAPPVPGVAPFAFPSAMTTADAAIRAYAAESLAPGRPLLAAAMELTTRIHNDFEYVPGATAADTLPADSFGAKRGVCQDYAHVMLAALRAFRLPARYVSGYLRTIPPEGQPRLEGADASHA
ncbi:MAG: transglutaminase family protein, partial [Pseudomonadota bacterium]